VGACVTGGATRAESVRAALEEVAGDAAAILVHDAARPLVTETVIGRVLAPLSQGWDAAVPGLPLPDTVKRVDGIAVVETLDRMELVAVQTPQAFVASVLREAFTDDVADASDCASLVERRGGRVCVVEGDPRLVKVTTDADLELVASWL
jgi:2-C-methyl-D-erythritol 4-phosphate cytidylyltransferase